MAENGQYIRIAEAARIKGVSRQFISKMIKKGRFRSKRVFGVSIVLRSDVEEYQVKTRRPKRRVA